MLYDLFICHATEDKDTFVRPLAKALRKEHVEVWFDEFTLLVGDSLRESIDKGLAQSRFGVVILSESFFRKRWTARELNGLVARQMAGDTNLILPVWHGVTQSDVIRYSPPLADIRGIESAKGVRHVVRELIKRVRPQQSPLVVAREELIAWGLRPPVVTDEWWLKVVVDSSRLEAWGMAIPSESTWGRWSFPLPDAAAGPEAMGLRLAWTALQREWTRIADDQKITQVTRPERVLEFIHAQPGLSETCHDFTPWLATYAPQLTIPGFGGEFEPDFDAFYKTDPSAEELMLRRARMQDVDAARVACQFVQGDIGGPSPKFYSCFDYIVWLLTSDSDWLPVDMRELLLQGMREWNVWWRTDELIREWNRPFVKFVSSSRNQKSDRVLSTAATRDLERLIKRSLKNLAVSDDAVSTAREFLTLGYVEEAINENS